MPFNSAAKSKFWDRKILKWENARYGKRHNSVAERLQQAVRILGPYVKGRRVVELGCGSGLLAQRLLPYGPRSYLGLDISEQAIAAAKMRFAGSGEEVQFRAVDAVGAPTMKADIVVSLGLLDWLTDAECKDMLARFEAKGFLHSYSSDRLTVASGLHRLMVFLQYGYRTRSYIPQYRNRPQIQSILPLQQAAECRFYSSGRLSFSELVYHGEFGNEPIGGPDLF